MRLFIQLIIMLLFACKPPLDPIVKAGCTDISACNYDIDAQDDDGSCEYAQENFDCDETCFDLDADGLCDHLGSFVQYFDTGGEALEADLTQEHLVVAANYQGFFVYDINRDEDENIDFVDSIYNNSDMDGTMGDNRAQGVIISETHNIAFITDIYDRIWLYKLAEGAAQYELPNYLTDCYGGTWLDVEIEDKFDHINVFTLVKHNASESDEEGTIGDFDEYSTSVVWKRLYDIDNSDIFQEETASPLCEFSYNFGALPEQIAFDDGLLAVSNGELGINLLKKLDQDLCFITVHECVNPDYNNEDDCILAGVCSDTDFLNEADCVSSDNDWTNYGYEWSVNENCINPDLGGTDGTDWWDGQECEVDADIDGEPDNGTYWVLIEEFLISEEFEPTGDIDFDRTVCQQEVDLDYEWGLNGIYEPAGGFYPYIFNSFDLPGEVNSVLMRNSVVFAGLSTSNGCYMSLLDNNGGVITNLQIADGYTINATAVNDRLIALASGHDGVLLFEWDGSDFSSVQSLGQINTPYCNSVEVDGNNLIISTEDGLYIYLIQ